ncbi:MAG: response regulator transcription factor [Acidimicrobiales bacterium]
MDDAPARVLVVEDEAPIRAAVDVALRSEGYEVRAEADASSIDRVREEFHPDLAVLDVRLPFGPDGHAAAKRLRLASNLPIIFLTAADSLEDRLAGFKAGADDYLVKPFEMAELLARSEALLRRSGRLRSAVWEIGDLIVDDTTRTATRAGRPLNLTQTEYQLLRVLVQRPGELLSKSHLLAKTWGFDAYHTNLVEVHVSALRRKLEVAGPRMVHTAVGKGGYVFRADAEA